MSNPTNFAVFDTETKPDPKVSEDEDQYHKLWFGYCYAFRRDGKQLTRTKDCLFKTPKEFWDFLLTRLDEKRPLWVFAHNIPFDLTIVDAWLSGDAHRISVDLPVLDDPPIILLCSHPRGKLCFVDTFNYWKVSVADIGKSVGFPKLERPEHFNFGPEWKEYCKTDVMVLVKAITNLLAWLEDNNLGSLKYTTPGIAMSIFKHKFMPDKTIMVHTDDACLKLERDAYHGGLVQPFFIGTIKQKTFKVDVNSLYPAMMKKPYPIRLLGVHDSMSIRDLKKVLVHNGAVANVSIESDYDPYPVYYDNRLIEATGKFTVPLCGAELIHALDHNHVTKVGRVQVYQMMHIFDDYVDFFWEMRKKYPKETHAMENLFAKLMLNSLYGKFGQQSHVWIDLTPMSLQAVYSLVGMDMPDIYNDYDNLPVFPIGIEYWTPLGLGCDLTIRTLPNKREMKVLKGEHHESSPIIAAYVTAYGRAFMRYLRNICGWKNTYYTDTDSLITNRKGWENLNREGWIDPNKLGSLKLEGESQPTIIYGPKDYVFQGRVTLKGIKKNAERICEWCSAHNPLDNQTCVNCNRHMESSTFLQTQFEGLSSVLRRDPQPFIRIQKVVKSLTRELTKGTKTKSGWVEYFRLNL